MIGFIGTVFSPWYAWSGRGDPEDHCCINVVTSGPGARFAMTDRGRGALRRSRDCLTIGPSSMRWDGARLIIDLNEISGLPRVARLRGRVTVTPSALTSVELPLTADGAHVWRPFAPICRIDVDLDAPERAWSGHGYFDANFGTRPLERDFRFWTWGRFPARDGALCVYDAHLRGGASAERAFHFNPNGSAEETAAPPRTRFGHSGWRLPLEMRADAGHAPRIVTSMLDAPFYARSVVETRLGGETVTGMHEALDLDRYASALIKPMLAMRVPRRKRWRFG
ncbi:carotenoid 1,2-hydratase [Marivita sp. GX14005]|nr:carotenoid 1,2-hydratase [Marivita sp. GX14005]